MSRRPLGAAEHRPDPAEVMTAPLTRLSLNSSTPKVVSIGVPPTDQPGPMGPPLLENIAENPDAVDAIAKMLSVLLGVNSNAATSDAELQEAHTRMMRYTPTAGLMPGVERAPMLKAYQQKFRTAVHRTCQSTRCPLPVPVDAQGSPKDAEYSALRWADGMRGPIYGDGIDAVGADFSITPEQDQLGLIPEASKAREQLQSAGTLYATKLAQVVPAVDGYAQLQSPMGGNLDDTRNRLLLHLDNLYLTGRVDCCPHNMRTNVLDGLNKIKEDAKSGRGVDRALRAALAKHAYLQMYMLDVTKVPASKLANYADARAAYELRTVEDVYTGTQTNEGHVARTSFLKETIDLMASPDELSGTSQENGPVREYASQLCLLYIDGLIATFSDPPGSLQDVVSRQEPLVGPGKMRRNWSPDVFVTNWRDEGGNTQTLKITARRQLYYDCMHDFLLVTRRRWYQVPSNDAEAQAWDASAAWPEYSWFGTSPMCLHTAYVCMSQVAGAVPHEGLQMEAANAGLASPAGAGSGSGSMDAGGASAPAGEGALSDLRADPQIPLGQIKAPARARARPAYRQPGPATAASTRGGQSRLLAGAQATEAEKDAEDGTDVQLPPSENGVAPSLQQCNERSDHAEFDVQGMLASRQLESMQTLLDKLIQQGDLLADKVVAVQAIARKIGTIEEALEQLQADQGDQAAAVAEQVLQELGPQLEQQVPEQPDPQSQATAVAEQVLEQLRAELQPMQVQANKMTAEYESLSQRLDQRTEAARVPLQARADIEEVYPGRGQMSAEELAQLDDRLRNAIKLAQERAELARMTKWNDFLYKIRLAKKQYENQKSEREATEAAKKTVRDEEAQARRRERAEDEEQRKKREADEAAQEAYVEMSDAEMAVKAIEEAIEEAMDENEIEAANIELAKAKTAAQQARRHLATANTAIGMGPADAKLSTAKLALRKAKAAADEAKGAKRKVEAIFDEGLSKKRLEAMRKRRKERDAQREAADTRQRAEEGWQLLVAGMGNARRFVDQQSAWVNRLYERLKSNSLEGLFNALYDAFQQRSVLENMKLMLGATWDRLRGFFSLSGVARLAAMVASGYVIGFWQTAALYAMFLLGTDGVKNIAILGREALRPLARAIIKASGWIQTAAEASWPYVKPLLYNEGTKFIGRQVEKVAGALQVVAAGICAGTVAVATLLYGPMDVMLGFIEAVFLTPLGYVGGALQYAWQNASLYNFLAAIVKAIITRVGAGWTLFTEHLGILLVWLRSAAASGASFFTTAMVVKLLFAVAAAVLLYGFFFSNRQVAQDARRGAKRAGDALRDGARRTPGAVRNGVYNALTTTAPHVLRARRSLAEFARRLRRRVEAGTEDDDEEEEEEEGEQVATPLGLPGTYIHYPAEPKSALRHRSLTPLKAYTVFVLDPFYVFPTSA